MGLDLAKIAGAINRLCTVHTIKQHALAMWPSGNRWIIQDIRGQTFMAHHNFDGMKYKFNEELWYLPSNSDKVERVRITGTWGPSWDKEYYEITYNDSGVEIVRTASEDELSRSGIHPKVRCECGGAKVNATAHSSWCPRFDKNG